MILRSEELWNATIMSTEITFNKEDFVDCAGIVWPPKSFPVIPQREPHASRFFPKDGDGFRAGKIEWDALVISLFVAQKNSTAQNQVLALELGASAAPWALTFVKYVNALTNCFVKTIAIEAGDVKKITRNFWYRNDLRFTRKQGFSRFIFEGQSFRSTFLRGIATNKGGRMFFPKVNVSLDNGATGSTSLTGLDRRGKIGFNRVRAIDTLKLIQNLPEVTLVHMDVQGSEVEIMQDPRFGESFKNVNVLLMGTHSVLADELAEAIDGKYGLTLISGNRMKPGGPNGEWPVDGEFLFVNKDTLNLLLGSGYLYV